jgi:hypothetical protein
MSAYIEDIENKAIGFTRASRLIKNKIRLIIPSTNMLFNTLK